MTRATIPSVFPNVTRAVIPSLCTRHSCHGRGPPPAPQRKGKIQRQSLLSETLGVGSTSRYQLGRRVGVGDIHQRTSSTTHRQSHDRNKNDTLLTSYRSAHPNQVPIKLEAE